MIYSLTEKLNFEEKPQIEIKGRLFTVESDAKTVLKLMETINADGETEGAMKATEYLFSETDRKALDDMGLNMADYTKVISTAISLAVGEDPDEKESEE